MVMNAHAPFAFLTCGCLVLRAGRDLQGRWSVASSEAKALASRGRVASSVASDTPLGLEYHYFSDNGLWLKDPTFTAVGA